MTVMASFLVFDTSMEMLTDLNHMQVGVNLDSKVH